MAEQDQFLEESMRAMREQIARLESGIQSLEVSSTRIESNVENLSIRISAIEGSLANCVSKEDLAHYATKHDLEVALSDLERRMLDKLDKTVDKAITRSVSIATVCILLLGAGLTGLNMLLSSAPAG